jgi:hypothetical protein
VVQWPFGPPAGLSSFNDRQPVRFNPRTPGCAHPIAGQP